MYAQKNEDEWIDVPFSVSTLNQAAVENHQIDNTNDLVQYTPNTYSFRPGPQGGFINIRGVGGRRPDEQSTGFLIDGVHHSGFSAHQFFDVQQIEVLKGPQSTLYGRNAESGVVSIRTIEPDLKKASSFDMTLANYNTQDFILRHQDVVSENSAIRIGIKQRFSDGYSENSYLNSDDGEENDSFQNFIKYLWRNPSKDTKILFKFDFDDFNSKFDSNVPYSKGPSHSTQNSHVGKLENDAKGASFNLEKKFTNFSIETIGSMRDSEDLQNLDLSADPTAGEFTGEFTDYIRELSVENRFSSNKNASSDRGWMIGQYVLRRKLEIQRTFYLPGNFNVGNTSHVTTDNFALFGQYTHPLSSRVNAIAGLRLDHEDSDFSWHSGTSALTKQDSFQEIIPKFSLLYKKSLNTNIFSSVSKGYQSGAFNVNTISFSDANTIVGPEESWTYEVGTKSYYHNGKIQLGITAFHTDWNNMQVYVSEVPNVPLRNVGQAESNGFELDVGGIICKKLQLSGSYGLADTTFKEYFNGSESLSGKRLPISPRYSYGANAHYDFNDSIYANISSHTIGRYFLNDANTISQKSYTTINISTGMRKKKWKAELWSKNILNEKYFLFAWPDLSNNSESIMSVGEPRVFGITTSIFI